MLSKNVSDNIINIHAANEINNPCINVLYAFSYSFAPIDLDIKEFVPLPIESPIEFIRINIGIEIQFYNSDSIGIIVGKIELSKYERYNLKELFLE